MPVIQFLAIFTCKNHLIGTVLFAFFGCIQGTAISDFDDAIARDVDCAEFYWWRGQAWEGKGEGEKAREDFQKAVALGYEEDEES